MGEKCIQPLTWNLDLKKKKREVGQFCIMCNLSIQKEEIHMG